MSPVPIYTPGRRETKWSNVPCLRRQRDGRGLNLGLPDPEFELLTARPHTPPGPTGGNEANIFTVTPVGVYPRCEHNTTLYRYPLVLDLLIVVLIIT